MSDNQPDRQQPPRRRGLTLALVALVAAVAGFGLHDRLNMGAVRSAGPGAPSMMAQDIIGIKRPDFTLPNLQGEPTPLNRWDGQVVLINFWATWCPPCRREIPGFMDLADRYSDQGFVVVGVAIDERTAVQDFVEEIKVAYPQLVGDQAALDIARQYGNRYGALPYSALVDRAGVIRFIKAGELKPEVLEAELRKLLAQA